MKKLIIIAFLALTAASCAHHGVGVGGYGGHGGYGGGGGHSFNIDHGGYSGGAYYNNSH